MRCQKCGRELQDDWIKCPYCNTEVIKSIDMKNSDSSEKDIVEVEKKKNNIHKNNLSLVWLKTRKILKIVLYIFVILLVLIGPFTSTGMGTMRDTIVEIAVYYVVLFSLIIPLALILNTRGIRDKLPLFNRRRVGTTVLASILTYVIICVFLVGIIMLSDVFHTQKYKEEQLIASEEKARISAEKEAAEKEATEKEAAEKEAAEKEAAEKEVAEKEAAEKEAVEKEVTENANEKQEKTNQQAIDIEEYSSYPYLSEEYLIYSLAQMEINFPLYPQEIVVQNYLDNCDNMDYQNVDILGIFSSYYNIVDEQTEYIYFGETKNGKPDGLGVIKERVINMSDNPENVDIRNSGLYNGVECYVTVYAGYFSNGKYDGFGMLYKTPIDEEYTNNGIHLDKFYQNIEGFDIEKNIAKTINPLVYVGEFSNGEYGAEGYEFYYTALNNADNIEVLDEMKENAIVVRPYIKDKASDLIFPKGDMPTFEIEDVLNYSYREHLH